MDQFLEVEVETDEQTLADNAIAQLKTKWPGWVPNDGDLEVVQIEALAPMAADANRTAAVVPAAVFRTVLEKLHKIPPQDGTAATARVTFQMVDVAEHLIDEGFAVDIDGVEFTVDAGRLVSGSLAVPNVAVTASVIGVVGNALTGVVVTPITASSFVSDVTLDAPTAGGTDPETDLAYQDRGSLLLELQGRTLVTERDYMLMAFATTGIGRSVAISNKVARQMNVWITNPAGEVASAAVKADLAQSYDELRLSNWVLVISDATYTTITVTTTVKAYSGYNTADLQARIDAALDLALGPAQWGAPTNAEAPGASWVNDPVVRKNVMIDVVASVPGVRYVDTLSIAGSAGAANAAGDWTMLGTVALPRPGAHVVTVT